MNNFLRQCSQDALYSQVHCFVLVSGQFTRQNVNFSMLKVFSKNIYIVNRNNFHFISLNLPQSELSSKTECMMMEVFDIRCIFWHEQNNFLEVFFFLRKKNLYVPSLQELLKLSLMMKKLPLTAYGWSRLVSSIK